MNYFSREMGLTGKITQEEIQELLALNPNVTEFVETGTYKAETTLEMAKLFNVYSVELSLPLYSDAYTKCAEESKIQLFHGDSEKILPFIATTLGKFEKKCIWFLDAHQSGHDSTHNGTEVPLLHELQIILYCTPNLTGHIFIFDDARLFDAYDDWKGINESAITQLFERNNYKIKTSFTRNDRFIVVL